MSEANTALRAVRASMLMSLDDFARAVRQAGDRAGEPNGCNKRLVQRWEAGLVTTPRSAYARALEAVTGQPIENLGFSPADEKYGVDRRQALEMGAPRHYPNPKGPHPGRSPASGAAAMSTRARDAARRTPASITWSSCTAADGSSCARCPTRPMAG